MGFDSHRCGTQPIPVENDIRIFVVFQVADELSGLTTPTILRDFVSESNAKTLLMDRRRESLPLAALAISASPSTMAGDL